MQTTFTIEEIRNYLKSCDSFGDAIHFLNAQKIIDANEINKKKDELEPVELLQQNELSDYFNCSGPDDNFNFIGVDGYEYKFNYNQWKYLVKEYRYNDIIEMIGSIKQHLCKMIDQEVAILVEN